jgi:hypothetical protein
MSAKTAFILIAGMALLVAGVQSRSRRIQKATSPQQTESVSTRSISRPRLPAPHLRVLPPPAESPLEDSQPAHLLAQLLNGGSLKLRREQIEPYLEGSRRSAESLLAAFRITADPTLLQEALERYPEDPRANLVASLAALQCTESSPEERRQRLEAFRQSAPDNALANYLCAEDFFQSGQTDQAVQELIATTGKTRFQDYSLELLQDAEEAYRAAGYSEALAKAAAGLEWSQAQAVQLRSLAHSLADLASAYRQTGDEASARAALQMGVTLGRQIAEQSPQPFLANDMLGLSIESAMLGGMDAARPGLDPAGPYDNAGHTVKDRLDELQQRAETQKQLLRRAQEFLPSLSEPDVISFLDRKKTLGEVEALQWAVNRRGNQ